MNVPAFDYHLRQNPISTRALADWRHPLGLNVGLTMLADRASLGDAIGAILQSPDTAARLGELASDEGLTWAAPRAPMVQDRFTLETLSGTDDRG